MKKVIIITLSIAIVAVLARFLTYQFQGFQAAKRMKMAGAPGVTIQAVEARDVARVSGYLTKSYFKEGDVVKKGQILFEIEPQEYQLAANKAKANLDNAQAQLIYYEKQLTRAKELVKQDYIAKAKYDEVLAQRDSYKAQVSMYRSAYQDALRNLSYTRVKAPVDGQVGMIKVTVGNYVTAQSGALTTLNSVDPIYVTFPLDAKNYTELLRIDKTSAVNRNVDLYFSTGSKYEFSGIQNFHDNNVDPTTGSILMRATFPNPKGMLINGNYATVYIYSKEKENVPVVPQIAVLENPQYKYVYKIDEKGLPQIQKIETFGQDGKDWVVKSGLKAGDRVIVLGIQGVIPSRPVRELTQEEIKAIDASANAKKESDSKK